MSWLRQNGQQVDKTIRGNVAFCTCVCPGSSRLVARQSTTPHSRPLLAHHCVEPFVRWYRRSPVAAQRHWASAVTESRDSRRPTFHRLCPLPPENAPYTDAHTTHCLAASAPSLDRLRFPRQYLALFPPEQDCPRRKAGRLARRQDPGHCENCDNSIGL